MRVADFWKLKRSSRGAVKSSELLFVYANLFLADSIAPPRGIRRADINVLSVCAFADQNHCRKNFSCHEGLSSPSMNRLPHL